MPECSAPPNPYALPITAYGTGELRDLKDAVEAELVRRTVVATHPELSAETRVYWAA